MVIPSGRDLLFGIKAFAGSMLALYIAFAADLPRPSWAMLTALIVAQPLAGMVRSKAIYRIAGTIVGAAFAVAVLPQLVDSPEVLSLAVATWVGGCLYLSLLDGTPRSYGFMLAGYTAALVIFPSVDAPGTIFDTAIARSQEIILGILCALVVNELFFPQRVGPVLNQLLDGWMKDAGRWIDDVLTERQATSAADRRKMTVDATSIDALRVHAAYDTPELRAADGWIVELQRRMQMLLSMLYAIEDRTDVLRESASPRLDRLRPVMAEIAAWVRDDRSHPGQEARRLRDLLARHVPPIEQARWDGEALLLTSLIARLDDLVRLWNECLVIRRRISRGGRLPGPRRRRIERHSDPALALRSALASGLSILVLCAFWIATAWPEGGTAAMIAAVVTCLFATADDPAPMMLNFLKTGFYGAVIGGLYLFGVFPHIDGFPMLVAVLTPFYVVMLTLVAVPAYFPIALPLAMNTTTSLGLQAMYSPDFAGFVNSTIALLGGIGAAAAMMRILRSLGAEQGAQRLIDATQADLARLATGERTERSWFEGRMFSRLSGIVARLRALAPEPGAAMMRSAFADLRIGLNLLALRRARTRLTGSAGQAVDELLVQLAALFRRRPPAGSPTPEPLLVRIDDTLRAIAGSEVTEGTTPALMALSGLRRALFAHAPVLEVVPPAALPDVARG